MTRMGHIGNLDFLATRLHSLAASVFRAGQGMNSKLWDGVPEYDPFIMQT